MTGGGGGLGREIALAFAGEGAKLVLADINWRNAGMVSREVRNLKSDALPLRIDITKEPDVRRLVAKTLERFGRIDILVNNAGVGFGADGCRVPVKDLTLKNWQTVLNINLTGAFLCSRAVVDTMTKQNKGVIINISSGMGKKGIANYAAYSASKFGLEGLTQVLALELAPFNIRVNALAPGGMLATPPVLARYTGDREALLQPSVIRDAIVYLASDDAKAIAGQSLSALQWNEEHLKRRRMPE